MTRFSITLHFHTKTEINFIAQDYMYVATSLKNYVRILFNVKWSIFLEGIFADPAMSPLRECHLPSEGANLIVICWNCSHCYVARCLHGLMLWHTRLLATLVAFPALKSYMVFILTHLLPLPSLYPTHLPHHSAGLKLVLTKKNHLKSPEIHPSAIHKVNYES